MDTPTADENFFPPELMHLLGTATHEIDQHLDDHGHCADCGCTWPCQRAQLAEFTLATL